MDSWEIELRATMAKMMQARDLLAARTQYRDRQLANAAASGVTWATLQKVTGLSLRGLAKALARGRDQ